MAAKSSKSGLTAKVKKRLDKVYFIITLAAAAISGCLGYAYWVGHEMVVRQAPQSKVVIQMQLELALSHLWFEEIISEDANIPMDEVLAYQDRANACSNAMLEGGDSPVGRLLPIRDSELRQHVEQVQSLLTEVRVKTLSRWQNRSESGIGSVADEEYDRVFNACLRQMQDIQDELSSMTAHQLAILEVVQLSLLAASLVIAFSIGGLLTVLLVRQARAQHMLRAAYQQLEASHQQLCASEQQLRASNQQLEASEQQLRASNQQLEASEQQLRASNQQLEASEQQLQAANRHLAASDKEAREARDRAEGYFNVAETMLIVIDRDGIIQRVNRKGCLVLGVDESEVLGKDWFGDFLPEVQAEPVREVFDKLMSGQVENVEFYENPIRTKQGEERLIGWHNALLRDGDDNIVGILSSGEDITDRVRAEQCVVQHQHQLQELVSQLTLAEERQRKQLAADLHDGICQSLAMAKLKVDEQLSNQSASEVAAFLADLQTTLTNLINDTRSLTNNLGTPTLQKMGLSAALEKWLETEISRKHGIETTVEDSGIPKILSDDTKTLLFRAVRELATNVVKHAQARSLVVKLDIRDDELSLRLHDDGKGFSVVPPLVNQDFKQGGYGLFSIQERITYMGGSMAIESESKRGSTVLLRLPLAGHLETTPRTS
jgi:PAS domain S-box-containing protein